jgi:UDP-glucose 4-epimerase
MNILLTGGAGYIGSHTATALSAAGHRVIVFDNFSNSSKVVIELLEQITGKTIPCVMGDILDTQLVESALTKYQIDIVMHFAGLKAVGESQKNPLDYYRNNVCGTLSLLQAMKNVHLKSMVFSSSATVYGSPHYLPYDENHPLNPINTYGNTKLHIEKILQDLSASDKEWKIVTLRYFNPVGAHPSGLIGESPNGLPNNLMPYIAQVALGRIEQLRVFGADYPTRDGTGIRDYIHVMDLADGHVAGLDYLSRLSDYEVFNLGTGKGTSVLELIAEFERVNNVKICYKILGRRPGDLSEFYAGVSKANSLLDWKVKRTLSEMCNSTWRYICKVNQ